MADHSQSSEWEAGAVLRSVDPYSLVLDLLKSLWAVILGAAAAAMFTLMFYQTSSVQTYTSTASFAVMSRTGSSYTSSNLSAAYTTASSLSNILNSDLMKKKVCEGLGLEDYSADSTASAIENTNIVTLSVTSESMKLTYDVIREMIRVYPTMMQYLSSNAVLQVLQEPTVPSRGNYSLDYSGPARRAFVIVFLLLLAAFAVLSVRRDTLKSGHDLAQKLDARALGVINHERKFKTATDLVHRRDSLLITDVTAGFRYVEEYRKIAAALTASAAQHDNARILLVTSVGEHEGKSTVAANLALALQIQGKKTVLIDGDLRRPVQARIFRKKVHPGRTLVDLLNGNVRPADAVYIDKKTGLYLLLSPKEGYRRSTEILSGGAFAQYLQSLKNEADFIVIDSPPMSLMADAEYLAGLAELSVMVVEYDRVPAEDVNDAIDTLGECQCPVAGCILNNRRKLPGAGVIAGYGYGYGHGYGYGRYGSYSRYGRYGQYGKYGKYGPYGAYGSTGSSAHYAVRRPQRSSGSGVSGVEERRQGDE